MENLTIEQLQERHADLVIELKECQETFHRRVDKLVDCELWWARQVQEGCEFWAAKIVTRRKLLADVEQRISELEVA
jgi:hypothetical protein